MIGESRAEDYKTRTVKRLQELKESCNAKWQFEVHTWPWGTPPEQNSDAPKSDAAQM